MKGLLRGVAATAAIACGAVTLAGQGTQRACAVPQPERFLRSGKNLAPNPAFSDASGWALSSGAVFDAATSHEPGSGSIDLRSPRASAVSGPVALRPGMRYTLAAYVRTDLWPALAYLTVDLMGASGKSAGHVETSAHTTTAPGRWEEVVSAFTVPAGVTSARIRIGRYLTTPTAGSTFERAQAWVDDVYLGEGLGFNDPPTPKRAFHGQIVSIDELGNFTSSVSGKPEPFFPLCIYGDVARFALYSRQGFNCIARLWYSAAALQQARAAVSPFNPQGLLANIEITQFLVRSLAPYADTTRLRAELRALAESPERTSVLAYYWDDEQPDEYPVPKAVTELVKALNVDSAGRRLHPIFALEGSQGRARSVATLADIVGDYLRPSYSRSTVWQSTAERFAILQNENGQRAPVTIGVLSQVNTAEQLRRLIYEGLIAGVRGFAYFKDGGCDRDFDGDPAGPGCQDITKRPAWAGIPELRGELETLKPVLREAIGTTWTAQSSVASVVTGTRDHDCDGYVFLVNEDSTGHTVRVTVNGLPYAAARAENVLTGATTPMTKDGFSVPLPRLSTAVVHLWR